jgi:hypothetical protein
MDLTIKLSAGTGHLTTVGTMVIGFDSPILDKDNLFDTEFQGLVARHLRKLADEIEANGFDNLDTVVIDELLDT